jgi:porin
MAANNKKIYGAAATLCVAATAGLIKFGWDGPAGAKAVPGHGGGSPSHAGGTGTVDRGAGGNGVSHFQQKPTNEPTVSVGETPPPTTQAAGGESGFPSSQPAEEPKTFWTQDRMTGDWGGLRTKLEDRGVKIDGSMTIAGDKTFKGGTSTAGNAESYKLSIGVTADLQKLANINGGSTYVNFQATDGKTNTLDGAFQVTDQAYIPRRVQVSELWYQQNLFDGKLRLKVGKIDANTEFAFTANGSEFVNSSMSYSPTILHMPTNPDPSTGLLGFVYLNDHLYAGVGMFDGSGADGISTGDRGPATLFEHSLFFIGEVGAKWTTSAHQDGRVGVGAWGQTAHFARYDGGTDDGTSGMYVVADQMFWRMHSELDGDSQGIAGFFQYGYADPAISPVEHHVGGGLTWTGMIPNRGSDIFGVGPTWVDFSHEPGAKFDDTGELDVEGFYKVMLTPWFSIKPDLQFLHNPGGVAGRPDTVVGSVQASLTF